MNNDEMQEKAAQYALGTLPSEELASFEEQLKKSRALQSVVHDWQRVNEIDAVGCRQLEPPFQAYAQIMSRIEEEEDEDGAQDRTAAIIAPSEENAFRSSASKRKVVPFSQWGGWAAAACLTLFVIFGALDTGETEPSGGLSLATATASADAKGDIVLHEMGRPGVTFASVSGDADKSERMEELLELADAYWMTRDSEAMAATASDGKPITEGFTIFDRKHKIGFIAIETMPDRVEGKSYHVWAKGEKNAKPLRAGSLPLGDSSYGLFFIDLSNKEGVAADADSYSFFVTEESTDKPEAPKGRVVLSGI